MKMTMLARFKLLRLNKKTGCYEELTKAQLDGPVSPGGFTFIIDGKEVHFDFDAFCCSEENGVFSYESGRGALFNDFEISDVYDEELERVGLNREDITPKFLASATEIEEFFVYFEEVDTEQTGDGVGDNDVPNAPYKVILLDVSFEDMDGNNYAVARDVIIKFNNMGKGNPDDYVVEYCPYCDGEQIIYAKGITACPNCGKPLVPCSVCEDCDYSTCPYGCDGSDNDKMLTVTNPPISEEEIAFVKLDYLLESYKRGTLRGDSHIEDYCEENGINTKDAFDAIAQEEVKGTKCEGCANAQMFGGGMYPCISCSRQASLSDHFKPLAKQKQKTKQQEEIKMKHYVVVLEWVNDGECGLNVIGVRHTREEARELFNKHVGFETNIAENNRWDIVTNTDDCFEAYVEGHYNEGHTSLTIVEVE